MMCMLDIDDDHTSKRPTVRLEDEHEGNPLENFHAEFTGYFAGYFTSTWKMPTLGEGGPHTW